MVRHHTNTTVHRKFLKVYGVWLFVLGVLTIFYFYRNIQGTSSLPTEENDYYKESKQTDTFVFEGEKIVHLDLKGAPPKLIFYSELFPLLAELGATGILIEYEDMFPYSGELVNISAHNAYTLDDINTINNLANKHNLKVIPLIQTFGHMEYVLKLAEFKELREITAYPQVICPTHQRTFTLIMTMLDQLIRAHPNIEMIHIGSDEVYYLGVCSRCSEFMLKNNLSKNLLFTEHVNSVVGIINKNFPKLRVLLWDDQFRSFSSKDFEMANLNKNIEPTVWKYSRDVYDELGPSLWNGYQNIFPKIWIASAFKGATASNDFVSHITHYLQNHQSWLSVVQEYRNRINFQGIIITGWQRFDHFAILCELLPVGIPTLAMCLRILLGFNDSPLSPPIEVAKLLKCEQPYALIGPVFGSPRCAFPGGDVLENVLHLQQLKQEYESIVDDSRVRGWMDDYNIARAFSSPSYVEAATESVDRLKFELDQLDTDITEALLKIYDEYTVEEWKETYLNPLRQKVNKLCRARKILLEKDVWPRRPLKNDEL
ncbi:unnamed protein product [Phaedon cochleariae]|uniref:beta-N-acetylhexosaminidase n=1 Tax=Phaedon cochleariae TaxID=80249 RepID=A0A9P0DG67_PHACE|nr:unnamed protein product [Phaedon cochleariae]